MRKHFKGLRQSGEVSGSMGQHGAAWGIMRKHFKGFRQSEEAWGSMRQHEAA